MGCGVEFGSNRALAPPAPPTIINPADAGLFAWWTADAGWVENGAQRSWTDQIGGYTLTNDVIRNVAMGIPERTITADNGFHPTIDFTNGVLYGEIPPPPAGTNFTVILVCGDESGQPTVFLTSPTLAFTGGFTTFFDEANGSAGGDVFFRRTSDAIQMRHWDVAGGRTPAEVVHYLDNVELPLQNLDNSGTFDSDFSAIGLGSRLRANRSPIFTESNVSEVMLLTEGIMDETTRNGIYAWWSNKRDTPAIPLPNRFSGVMFYGQSNAYGFGTLALSNRQFYGPVSYLSGLITFEADAEGMLDRSRTAPLIEKFSETGASIAFNVWTELSAAQAGVPWNQLSKRHFAICPARGGRGIDELIAGEAWETAQDDINGMVPAAGATPTTLDWIVWVHGTSDFDQSDPNFYAPRLQTLYSQTVAEAQLTMPTSDPVMLISQPATHRYHGTELPFVQLGMEEAENANSKIQVAFPMYPLSWNDQTHLDVLGQQIKGAYIGKAMYDIENGGNNPVRISEVISWSPTVIQVRVTGGTGNYVVDTSEVGVAPNSGFDIFSSANVLEDIISSVNLVGDVVTIMLSTPASAGARLGYGWGRVGMAAPSNGPVPLGNIRDDDPRTVTIDSTVYNLHNYALVTALDQP